jgi:hypothetical protein
MSCRVRFELSNFGFDMQDSSDFEISRLQQHDALGVDLDSLPTLRAADDVIQPDHVIPGLLEARAILLVCAAGERWFLCPANPSYLVLPNLFAGWAAQRLLL